jgi:hypothetical protein
MNSLEGLAAAPQTYLPRHQPTGLVSLDAALDELAQQPWIEILSADPGSLMPGNLDEEMRRLESDPQVDPKAFMTRSMGLHQYHEAKLTIRFRVLEFSTFHQWIAGLRRPMMYAPQVLWTVQMHPIPQVLLFSVTFQYLSPNDPAFVAAAILHSLREIPL